MENQGYRPYGRWVIILTLLVCTLKSFSGSSTYTDCRIIMLVLNEVLSDQSIELLEIGSFNTETKAPDHI